MMKYYDLWACVCVYVLAAKNVLLLVNRFIYYFFSLLSLLFCHLILRLTLNLFCIHPFIHFYCCCCYCCCQVNIAWMIFLFHFFVVVHALYIQSSLSRVYILLSPLNWTTVRSRLFVVVHSILIFFALNADFSIC